MKNSPGSQGTTLKDSHIYETIFENASTSMWEEDFSWCKETVQKLKDDGVVDFRNYLTEFPHFTLQAIENVRINNVNLKSVELFEAETKEVLLASLTSTFLPETFAVFEKELVAIAEEQTHFESEAVVKTLNGKRLNVLIQISFPKRTDEFDRVYVTIIDITKHKEIEKKLQSREHQYRSLIEQATDGIFVSDSHGKYIDVNESGCAMLGYTREEILRLNVRDLLLLEEIEKDPPKFAELASGKTIKNIRRLRRKDGSTVTTEINAKMLSTGEMLGMVRDVTERQDASQKLLESEEKFRNLTETAFDAIVIMNEERNIIFWNRGAESIFGFSKQEVLNKPMIMIIPEKYRKAHNDGIERYLSTGRGAVMGKATILEGQKKNGDVFPIEISITSWQVGNGKLFSGIIRDITERKKTENEIKKLNTDLEIIISERTTQLESKIRQYRESEDKFQKVFYASSAGISITRLSDARYIDVNHAFEEITGFTKEELLEHTSVELGLITNIPRREEILREVKEKGSSRQFEMTVQNKSGKTIEVISSIETIVLNGERLAINIIYDITDRKRVEEQLALVNKELEAFSYSVSHDLRAPLRAIIGYSEMLLEDYENKVDDEGSRFMKAIQGNGKKMNILIDDLLSFSKLGKKELSKSVVDSNALVKRLTQELKDNASFTGDITISDLPAVNADSGLLAQVWSNLISNAIKYTSKKEHPLIEISTYQINKEIVFYIKDNGAGFDMKYANKLFGVFQRLHSVEEFEGIGIGLSIVNRIVNKHNGRVWADAKPDQGATFYFSLPIVMQTPVV